MLLFLISVVFLHLIKRSRSVIMVVMMMATHVFRVGFAMLLGPRA